jgi:transcriptional regulator with XRE-family HTH domain
MAKIKPPQLSTLGEFIAGQRRAAELSLRQLAEQTGVSNPYLSQIERGLRKPSAEVLQQLSKALRVSAETLYVRAGILDPEDHRATTVEMAVLADTSITERQRRVLIDVYNSFVKENEPPAEPVVVDAPPAEPVVVVEVVEESVLSDAADEQLAASDLPAAEPVVADVPASEAPSSTSSTPNTQ